MTHKSGAAAGTNSTRWMRMLLMFLGLFFTASIIVLAHEISEPPIYIGEYEYTEDNIYQYQYEYPGGEPHGIAGAAPTYSYNFIDVYIIDLAPWESFETVNLNNAAVFYTTVHGGTPSLCLYHREDGHWDCDICGRYTLYEVHIPMREGSFLVSWHAFYFNENGYVDLNEPAFLANATGDMEGYYSAIISPSRPGGAAVFASFMGDAGFEMGEAPTEYYPGESAGLLPELIDIVLHQDGSVTITPPDPYIHVWTECSGNIIIRLPAWLTQDDVSISMAGGWKVDVFDEIPPEEPEEDYSGISPFRMRSHEGYTFIVFEPLNFVPFGGGPTAPDAPTRGQVSIIRFTDVQSLALGGIALDAAGKVWSWGYNGPSRQLGLGLPGDAALWNTSLQYAGGMRRMPFFVNNNIVIEQIFTGYHTAAAISDDGRLFMWGDGRYGQMGIGNNTTGNRFPVEIPASAFDYRRIITMDMSTYPAVGAGTVVAVDEYGDVWGWGSVYTNRLPGFGWSAASSPGGDGTGSNRHFRTPQRLTCFDNAPPIVQISLGHSHGIALDENGNVWSWGYGLRGSLGRGANPGRAIGGHAFGTPGGLGMIPFFPDNDITIASIDASYHTNVAICTEGRAYAWGWRWENTTGSEQSWSHPAAGTIHWFDGSAASQTVNVPRLVEFDLRSSPWNDEAPRVKLGAASGRVIYLIDVYGRLWYQGWNTWHGFAVDGPITNNTRGFSGAKHSGVVPCAAMLRTMGDGSTQARTGDVMAPVFSDQPRGGGTGFGLNDGVNHWATAFNAFVIYGRWSSVNPWNNGAVSGGPSNIMGNYVGDGRNPTIYDKIYMYRYPDDAQPGLNRPNTAAGRNGQALAHRYQYPIDAEGYRLVYVIRSQNGVTGAAGLISGNFYRVYRDANCTAEPGDYRNATWAYNGPWAVNRHTLAALPAGVSEVTSIPQVHPDEQGWIGLSVDIDEFDYTGNQRQSAFPRRGLHRPV